MKHRAEKKLSRTMCALVACALLLARAAQAQDTFLDAAAKATARERQQACELARWAVTRAMAGKPAYPLPHKPAGLLAKALPCFVTIELDGRRHGCTGSFEPRGANLATNIVQTAVRAWSLDARTRAISASQLKRAVFLVTVPGRRRAVSDPADYPPGEFGLVAQSGGKTGVLLPGEARTTGWQKREALRQAGLSPGASARLYVFRAVTFRERPRISGPASRAPSAPAGRAR